MGSELMKIAVKTLAAIVLGGLLSFPLGCDEGSSGPGGPQASLVVTFEPNPVAHVQAALWRYEVHVTEVGGVGVFIYGYTVKEYSAAGVEYTSSTSDASAFSGSFLLCGGEGSFMPAGSVRCSNAERTEGRNTGYNTWTFFGLDELGNEVTTTGRVEFL
jgi:hypothetical protein